MGLSAHHRGKSAFRLNVYFTFIVQTLITVPIHTETKKPMVRAPERRTRGRMDLPANRNLFHITVMETHPHRTLRMGLSTHHRGKSAFRLNVYFTFIVQTLITVPIHTETKKPMVRAPERRTRGRMDLPANRNLFHITVMETHPHRTLRCVTQTIPPRLHIANQ
jgi:hypothetical protein